MTPRRPIVIETEKDLAEAARIKQQTETLKALQKRWAELSRDRTPMALRVDALEQRISSVEKRIGKLEEALNSSPEKALALPLMRKDLDAQKDSASQAVSSLQSSIDHLYDLTFAFIGAIGLTIMGLGIRAFVSHRARLDTD